MISRKKRITGAIALFVAFSVVQLTMSVTLAGSGTATGSNSDSLSLPQQATGVLTTQANKEITVNGASAISGATIVSGATIETPAGVGGTVNLGKRGSLDIGPGAKLVLDFDSNTIKVMLLQGCVTLHSTRNTTGEIDTSKGVAGKTDPKANGVLRTCADGAVSTAPAAAAAKGGLFGLGTAATIAIIAGGGAGTILPIILGGGNSSPRTPTP